MSTHAIALPEPLVSRLSRWLRSVRIARKRRVRWVTIYRISRGDRTDTVYADQGDEALLGRYVADLLRDDAPAVMIERLRVTLEQAQSIERTLE